MGTWMGGLLECDHKYTVAQVELARKKMELGTWADVSWDLKQQTGLSATQHTLLRWFRRDRTPCGQLRLHRMGAKPYSFRPCDRHIVNLWLGIEDTAWWTWHERSHGLRGKVEPREESGQTQERSDDPFDMSFLSPD